MAGAAPVEPQGKAPVPRAGLRKRLYLAAAVLTHVLFVLVLVLVFVRGAGSDGGPEATGALSGQGDGAQTGAGRDGVQEAALRRKQSRPERHPAPEEPVRVELITPQQQAHRNLQMDRLVAAYPDFLAGHTDNEVIWRDGTRLPFDDGRKKDFEARLAAADIEDQFSVPYPAGPMLNDPEPEFDPGRFRNDAFFSKMYGDCRKREVEKKLVDVVWLPKHGGKKIRITSVNGVAEKLQNVSNELDNLPSEFLQYLQPVAGTFNCRVIAGTERTSAHGFGFAIDLNAKFGDYWQWQRGRYAYRNRIPWEIAAIFEKHGFIWGAKWYHYDSLHFEYRPELLNGDDASTGGGDVPVPMPEKQPRNLD